MKSAPFEYFDPDNIEELLNLLQQYGDEAKLMAGGQSLGPLLNMRLAMPAVVIDLNRVQALDFQQEIDDQWAIGASTRQSRLEDDSTLTTRQPLVAATIPYIGHRAIRNRGTVGGSIAHADPAAEWPALAMALDAEIIVQRAGNPARMIKPEAFFVGPLMNALEPEEMVTAVRLPTWPTGAGWSILEFCQRHRDFAVIGVVVRLTIDPQRQITDVRIALMGAGPIPIRARQAEALLIGEQNSETAFEAAAHQASIEIEPDSDIHGSANYRRHLARLLVAKGLIQANERAKGGQQ